MPPWAIPCLHRLKMEIDLQSLFGLLCTAVLIGWDPATLPPPPHLGSFTRALLVRQDRRHLFVTPCLPETYICPVGWCEGLLIALFRSCYAQNSNSPSLQNWQIHTPAIPSEENCSQSTIIHRCCYCNIMMNSATAESQNSVCTEQCITQEMFVTLHNNLIFFVYSLFMNENQFHFKLKCL
jgi:hypothetical protein